MIIGLFTEKDDGSFVGAVQTLFFRAEKVVFEPLQQVNPKGPAYRIYTGSDLEIGAAWTKASKTTGEVTLSVLFDDPTLVRPIRCLLSRAKDSSRWMLIWHRASKATKDVPSPAV
jgi:uncharacterized protein (DUF736 family)